MRVGVVSYPGACDDRDAMHAVALMGAEPVRLWHADPDLGGVDADDAEGARRIADEIAGKVLSNPLIEQYQVEVAG